MKTAINTYFILLLSLITLSANAATLTENDVKKLIAAADQAAVSLNADALAATLSNNVVIIMNIDMQGQKHVMKPSKQEYIAMLKQGWSTYTDYTYKKSNVVIKMQSGKALVTADVKESMTVQGQTMSGESKEEVVIEMINNTPMITKVVGYTSM